MDSILNDAVSQYELNGRSKTAARDAAGKAPINNDTSIAVSLHTNSDHTQSVVDFLTRIDIQPRNIVDTYRDWG